MPVAAIPNGNPGLEQMAEPHNDYESSDSSDLVVNFLDTVPPTCGSVRQY